MEILVAEDEALVRVRLLAQLKAWEILQTPQSPKLALIDWMMPGADGPELCRRVRRLEHGSQMYLILLTGRDSKEDLVAGLESGANDYVTKPFDPAELRARLNVGMRVTELQQRLIEAERHRAVLQTAGAAAHELAQPLQVMLGNLELMVEQMDGEVDGSLRAVLAAGQRITEIVKQMESTRHVTTKRYTDGVEIIDLKGSSE
jgi:DNA-binding response OmpR family regulator